MEYYLATTVFVFGLLIGSFLNVVLYRMHTGRSLSGHSHCLSCGTRLRWFELFPLFSYVVLRGRCRTCGAHIPSRYFLVELSTALLFLIAWCTQADPVAFVVAVILLSVLVLVVVYDIRHTIIPNELTAAICICALGSLGYEYYQHHDLALVGEAVLSGVGAGAFLGALWFVSKGRWIGFGDVKLVVPLGILVPYPLVFSMVVYSFWIGAFISVLIIAVQTIARRGQMHLRFGSQTLRMKSEVPFAPFLVAGFLLTYFWKLDVLEIMFNVFV